ncbi:winged helix DNA-binding domain-containing protein [Pseudonocardia saturnea]
MRELSWARLNRALLARQLLLDRADLTPVTAVERLGGLQTQYSPSAYVGLWSRLAGFRREHLTGALLDRRIVQAWVMRCTIHMVSAADYPPLTEAVREQRRLWWTRGFRDLAGVDMPAVADTVRDLLAGGPRKQAEIVAHLVESGFPKAAFSGVQLWVDLVRVPPAGTWDLPRAHVYGLAEQWLRPSATPMDRAAAEERLARRYLRGYGPATPGDLSRYAGWTITQAKGVLERIPLRTARDPDGAVLVDLPRAPLPDADTPAPVRFLSNFDGALLLGHATRARLLPPEHRDKVFHTRMPQSTPTFLVDGRVAGTWRFTGGQVETTPFEPLPPTARDEVAAEAERLTAFHLGG